MEAIQVVHKPSSDQLEQLGVHGWPTWSKEVSSFPWSYDEPETCYLLQGEAVVTPATGQPVRIVAGDLVTFPAGLTCTWDVHSPVRKHYRFG